MGSSKTKVLATESNTFKRRIRKAIEIKLRKPRDNGFELASIYDTILALPGPLTFLTFKFALWLTKFGGSQRNIPLQKILIALCVQNFYIFYNLKL